jgi:hypothetical protein
MIQGIFGAFPIWVVFVGTLVGLAAAAKAGHVLGVRMRTRLGDTEAPDLGATLGGLLGLLALLLAFTFGMAGERFDWRKTLVVNEANAIGTAWLRTDLIPEPQAAQARRVLRAYTQARLDVAVASTRSEAIRRSEKLQSELWGITREAAAAAPTPTVALFVQAVNEVIDVHGMRVQAALRNPIPPTIFATLFAVSILVLAATGYAGGLTRDRSAIASILLGLVLAVVISLILDLDRPYEGLLTVSQQAMVDVLTSMGAAGPTR